MMPCRREVRDAVSFTSPACRSPIGRRRRNRRFSRSRKDAECAHCFRAAARFRSRSIPFLTTATRSPSLDAKRLPWCALSRRLLRRRPAPHAGDGGSDRAQAGGQPLFAGHVEALRARERRAAQAGQPRVRQQSLKGTPPATQRDPPCHSRRNRATWSSAPVSTASAPATISHRSLRAKKRQPRRYRGAGQDRRRRRRLRDRLRRHPQQLLPARDAGIHGA